MKLVTEVVAQPGSFEIRVHDDGSSDGTVEALRQIESPKLHITSGLNCGRASALASAVARAKGQFTMLFDDDDELWPEGLQVVLEDCARRLPSGVVGYVYHLSNQSGWRVGDGFPVELSNFLELRIDCNIRGDKKEVVRTDVLKPIILYTKRLGRRVPTSLYWSTMALKYDVICRDIEIGRKHYEQGGMTDRIRGLKKSNPKPLMALYVVQARGFLNGRFRSSFAAARVALALAYYCAQTLLSKAVLWR